MVGLAAVAVEAGAEAAAAAAAAAAAVADPRAAAWAASRTIRLPLAILGDMLRSATARCGEQSATGQGLACHQAPRRTGLSAAVE